MARVFQRLDPMTTDSKFNYNNHLFISSTIIYNHHMFIHSFVCLFLFSFFYSAWNELHSNSIAKHILKRSQFLIQFSGLFLGSPLIKINLN